MNQVPATSAGSTHHHGPITVVGAGRTAEAVESWLADHVHAVTRVGNGQAIPPSTAVVVFADDGPQPSGTVPHPQTRVPWLGVGIELEHAVVGPAVRPGMPGCLECA